MSRDERLSTVVPRGVTQRRLEEYWSWVAVVLFLLVTVDLLTTYYAVAELGVGGESNPLMAWLIGQPFAVVAGVNVAVVVLAATFFYGVVRMLERTPEPYDGYFAVLVELWLGVLLAAGLFVFANNLSVIVLGESLL